MTGLIFDIQGFSVHDGSGCRTVVFMCGCPLRCTWCSNPEGMLPRPRLMYRERKCVHTHYRCVKACPHGAVSVENGGNPALRFKRSICDSCDSRDCVAACLNDALHIAGRSHTVDDLMRILVRDQGFWGSQGGVTFSGGEPMSQPEFLLAVLTECRSKYIHTTLETCAHADTDLLLEISQQTDWMFIDIKHLDSDTHRSETGVGNELILKNIETMAYADWGGRLVIRVPIVPGFNDTQENLRATAALIAELKLKEVNLLPFHRLGESKYEQLGLEYKHAHLASPFETEIHRHRHIFESAGLRCYVGSDTPF